MIISSSLLYLSQVFWSVLGDNFFFSKSQRIFRIFFSWKVSGCLDGQILITCTIISGLPSQTQLYLWLHSLCASFLYLFMWFTILFFFLSLFLSLHIIYTWYSLLFLHSLMRFIVSSLSLSFFLFLSLSLSLFLFLSLSLSLSLSLFT